MDSIMANALGIMGTIIHIIALSNVCDVRMKRLTALSSVFFVGYFFLIGLPIAALCTIVGIVRYYLASFIEGKLWLVFAVFYIGVAFLTPPEDIIHVFPVIASLVGTYALFNMKGLPFRNLMIFMTFLWVCYGIYSGAHIVIIKESILFMASAFAIYKLIYGDPFKRNAFRFALPYNRLLARWKKT
jgi:hypothetical protein